MADSFSSLLKSVPKGRSQKAPSEDITTAMGAITKDFEKKGDEAVAGMKAVTEKYRDPMQKNLAETRKILDDMKSQKVDLKPIPDETDQQARDPTQALGSMASVLALIGSLATRRPLVTAMNSAAAAMEGFHQGDLERMKRERENFHDKLEQALRQNQAELEKFNAAIGKDEAELHALFSESKDQQGLAMLEMGDKEILLKRAEGMANIQLRMLNTLVLEKTRLAQIEATKEANWQRHADRMMMGGFNISSQQIESLGAQVASGVPLNQIVGYGRSPQFREQARFAGIQQIMKETGMSAAQAGSELARRQLDFQGIKGSVSQLQKMYGATKQAVSQLEFNIQKTTEAMDKLPSSDMSPVINAIARGEQKWTGDPAYAELFFYMNASGMESARILSGGQASIQQLHEGARKEAKEWSDAGFTTPAMWKEGVAPAMMAEGKNRLQNFEQAIASQRSSIGINKDPTHSETGQLPPGWTVKER